MSFNSKYTGAQVEAWLDNIKNYSANDILEKVKTVDGSGSGLDADLLDGKQPSELNVASAAKTTYLKTQYANSTEWYDNYVLYAKWAEDKADHLDIKTDGYYTRVDVAKKLNTARTIWGQSFDGTGNISGAISGVETITFNSSYAVNIDRNSNFVFKQPSASTSMDWAIQKSDGSKIMMVRNDGNVGIGTASPSDKLSIAGGCGVNDYLNIVATNNITAQFTMYASSGGWRFQNNPNANGNLELIFRSPSAVFTSVASFTSSGNLLVTGGVVTESAKKLKNVTDERGLSLEELRTIKPTRFTWKDGRDDKIHIGGIADDVQRVLPEVIYKTTDDTLTMDYGNAAFAISASLIKPVIDHEERIKVLEEENKRLKEEVEQLKCNIAQIIRVDFTKLNSANISVDNSVDSERVYDTKCNANINN